MSEKYYPAFSSGEISPALYGRADLQKYGTALRECTNFVVRPFGGVSHRPALKYHCRTKYRDQDVVMVRFRYSRTDAYILEFGPQYILFIKDGARVTIGAPQTIVDVTAGVGILTVTTTGPHGYAVDDVVSISGVLGSGVIPDINDSYTILGVPTADSFTVERLTLGSGTYTSGGTVDKCLQVITPYSADDLAELRFTQSVDVMTIFHNDHKQRELRRLSANLFEMVVAEYRNGPFLPTNTDESRLVHASATTGNVTLYSTVDIFTPNHVGALFKLEEKNLQQVPPWTPATPMPYNSYGIQRRNSGRTYACVTTNTSMTKATGAIAPTHDYGIINDGWTSASSQQMVGLDWWYLHSGYGICRITGYVSAKEVTASVLSYLPVSVTGGAIASAGPWTGTGDGATTTLAIAGATTDEEQWYEVWVDNVRLEFTEYTVNSATDVLTFNTAPGVGEAIYVRQLAWDNRTDYWAFGAWSDEEGYPSCGTYFDDRLWQAGTRNEPQRVDASMVGNYYDYGTSVPLEDDDALSITMNTREVNAILDILPTDKLLVLTNSAINKIGSGADTAISPSTVGFEPQAYFGAHGIPAIVTGETAIYVQRGGNRVREVYYDDRYARFVGEEVSLLARHLFSTADPVVDMDWDDTHESILWLVTEAGNLRGMTFLKEQEVAGWHKHVSSGARFKRVCVIPEGNEDVPYFVVQRTVAGQTVQYIESLLTTEPSDELLDFCLDSHLTYDGRANGAQGVQLTAASWNADDLITVTIGAGDIAFLSTDVGNQVWAYVNGSAWAGVITAVAASNSCTVQAITDVPVDLRTGLWYSWALAKDEMAALGHLVGETVRVVADGLYAGEYTVSEEGRVVMDSHGAVVHVGLPYTPAMETLDLDAEFLANKKITSLGVYVMDTKTFWAGDPGGELNEYLTRDESDDYAPPASTTDMTIVPVNSGFSRSGRIRIEQRLPLPIRVLSIAADIVRGSA